MFREIEAGTFTHLLVRASFIAILVLAMVAGFIFWPHGEEDELPFRTLACQCEEHRGGALPATNTVPTHTALPASGTTFAHVAPLLQKHCVACHQPGSVAPFPLRSYEEAAPFAFAISEAVTTRRMPPFNLDNSGACQTFRHARWLSENEIATFRAWVNNGLPRGDTEQIGEAPRPERLNHADLTYDIGISYAPKETGADDFRCFEVQTGLQTDAFVTAYQITPGEPRSVHHVNLYAWDDNEQHLEEDAGSCEGLQPEKTRWLGGWAPGVSLVRWPENLGVRLRAGQRIVFEIHYRGQAGAGPDRTAVQFKTSNVPVREVHFTPIAITDIDMAPGQAAVSISSVVDMEGYLPESYTLYGVVPHMHQFGKSLRLALDEPDGTCLAHADRWNFYQHGFFFYAAPLTISKAAPKQFALTCVYDTRTATEAVQFGMTSGNEMCQAMLMYAEVPR